MLGDSPTRNALFAALVLFVGLRLVLGEFTVFGSLAPLAFGVAVFFQIRWAIKNRQ